MVSIPIRPYAPWPPDDTEESVVGTNRHQMTIMNIRLGVNEAAHAEAAPDGTLPWTAMCQTMITGFARPDGSRYTTLPDVFVYREPINQDRGSLSLLLDGSPLLIIEVASESTYESDLDLVRGKGYSYARAGVREYLVLDPTGVLLPELGRGWQLVDGMYQQWAQDPQGRWQSSELPLSFAVDNWLASVYLRQDRLQLREGEITAALAAKDAEIARKDAELARKDAELAELRRRLEER
jgi:hypothetical protein